MVKEDEKVKWYLRPLAVVLSLFFFLGSKAEILLDSIRFVQVGS